MVGYVVDFQPRRLQIFAMLRQQLDRLVGVLRLVHDLVDRFRRVRFLSLRAFEDELGDLAHAVHVVSGHRCFDEHASYVVAVVILVAVGVLLHLSLRLAVHA